MNAVTKVESDLRHDSLLRLTEVRRRTGMSTATIYRREAAGEFPKRIKLGPNMVAWYESQIDRFVADPVGYRS